ncbi:putative Ig domain-containing protein [Methanococcoides burtonii]|uniref:putative Ig domain-containing protein n=1 Tax=Methanococcoides burtonii TaxID=29291 RepID=UPI001E2EBD2E|nr:putative Ig domain-containing protein [Methanococcoides burtonii]
MSINLTDIYDALYPTYGDQLISNAGNGIWYLNKTLLVDRSTVYITSPEVTELRVSGSTGVHLHGTSTGSDGKGYIIENVTIVGWLKDFNMPDNTVSKKSINIDKGHVSNSVFKNVSTLKLYNVYDTDINNIEMESTSGSLEIADGNNSTVHEIALYNTSGFYTYDLENFIFHNITVKDVHSIGTIRFTRTSHSLFYDFVIERIGSYLKPGSGGGLYWYDSSYNTGSDFYINDTGWSSFAPGNNYGNWSDLTILNSGHNGIDLHNIKNTIINNVHVYDSVSNNILLTAGLSDSPSTENITITNVYSKNSGIVSQQNVSDIYLANIYQEGDRDGMGISVQNFTLINATFASLNSDAQVSIYDSFGFENTNCNLIDTSFYHLNVVADRRINLINSEYQTTYHKNHVTHYYSDLFVTYSNDIPAAGATIAVENTVDSSHSSLNGFGNDKSMFLTTSNGHTELPNENRSESPAMPEYYKSSAGTQTFSHTATITTQDGQTLTLPNITPDSSWYRPDPNTPTYSITAIMPDESAGPHLTGFAPSESNPFNIGNTKKFQVWSDEDMTSMKWIVDGETKQSTSLEYAWTVPDENGHTIIFEGTNANGIITKTWDINGGSGSVLPAITGAFPGTSSRSQELGSSTDFSVTADQSMTSMVWYKNDAVIADGVMSTTVDWNEPGTYNIRFTASNDNGEVSRSWEVVSNEGAPILSDDLSVNNAPVITTFGPANNTVFQEGNVINIGVIASDADGDELTYLLKVDGATVSTTSGYVWTTDSSNIGAHTIGVVVSDGVEQVTDQHTIIVQNIVDVGVTPVVMSSSAQIVSPGQPFSIGISIDPSEPVSGAQLDLLFDEQLVSAEGTIEGDLFNLNGASTLFNSGTIGDSGVITDIYCSIIGAAPVSSKGTMATIAFTAGNTAGVAEFSLSDVVISNARSEGTPYTVTDTMVVIDTAPVLNSIGDKTVDEENALTFVTSASDADGDSLTYSATGLPVGASFDTASGAFSWTPSEGQEGTYAIAFEVSDSYLTDSETISIAVKSHPRWDINRDCAVNILDITLVSQKIGTDGAGTDQDVNQDGVVNIQDLTLVAQHFGETVE